MPAPADSLYALADQYHLLPLIVVFILIGALTAASMAFKSLLGFLEENQRAFYEFRARWAENKRRYGQTVSK